jgi:hypothetical protein
MYGRYNLASSVNPTSMNVLGSCMTTSTNTQDVTSMAMRKASWSSNNITHLVAICSNLYGNTHYARDLAAYASSLSIVASNVAASSMQAAGYASNLATWSAANLSNVLPNAAQNVVAMQADLDVMMNAITKMMQADQARQIQIDAMQQTIDSQSISIQELQKLIANKP